MYEDIVNRLRMRGIEFETGLSDEEFYWIEHEYELTFPKELKNFYKYSMPISDGFYNWRDKTPKNILYLKSIIEAPVKWMVENSEEIDWSEKWGEEPAHSSERNRKIREMALKAAKLIPIYSHRYMASVECEAPPIFSVYGTDIIIFAKNLIDYFLIEFELEEKTVCKNNQVSYIPFWSDLL